MKKILLALALLLCAQFSFSQSSKEKDIVKLLEVTGSANLGMQAMNNIISSFKQSYSSVPEEFWDELMSEINPNDLIEMIIPIYDKYYSHEEILELISFYESDLGKRVVQLQPAILQDSMNAGQEWGQEIAAKVVKRLERKGY